MSTNTQTTLNTLQQEITQCEQQRCDALVKGDIAALEKLLTQDLVHIHANGQGEDTGAYLNTVAQASGVFDGAACGSEDPRIQCSTQCGSGNRVS